MTTSEKVLEHLSQPTEKAENFKAEDLIPLVAAIRERTLEGIRDGLQSVPICGARYRVFYSTAEEDPRFDELDCSGYCEVYAKEIHVKRIDRNDPMKAECVDQYEDKVLRHEVLHAFLFECGQSDYWEDERLVDTLALIFPKLTEEMAAAQCSLGELRDQAESKSAAGKK